MITEVFVRSFMAWLLVIGTPSTDLPKTQIVYDTKAHCEEARAHVVDKDKLQTECVSITIHESKEVVQ